MADEPRKSWSKRFVREFSKRVEPLKRGSKQSQVGPFDRPSSAPPNIPEGSGQQLGASVVLQTAQSPLISEGSTFHHSGESLAGMGNTTTSTGATLAPNSTRGPIGSSSAAQTTKFVFKGALGLLSSAADGIPIPGVKGIFETIIKVIGVVEVSDTV